MVRAVGSSSSSGQTPEIPQEKKLKRQSTQYQSAIKKLGLEKQESRYFERTESKKSVSERVSKPPKGGVALPIRPHTGKESKPPSAFASQRPRGRTVPSSSLAPPSPESLQLPPRPPRKISAPTPLTEPAAAEIKEQPIPPSSSRAARSQPQEPIFLVSSDSEDSDLNLLAEPAAAETKEQPIPSSSSRAETSEPHAQIIRLSSGSEDSEGSSEGDILPSSSHRPKRVATSSEDQAFQILLDPNEVQKLSRTSEGRRELYAKADKLLKSTVVDFEGAAHALHTIIGAGTRAVNASLRGGAKITDEELKKEMALLQASIKKFERIEAREAIQYASRTGFENSRVDGEQIDQAVARYNEIKDISNHVIQASINKMGERSAIYQQISDLTGGTPVHWINAHIPGRNDRRRALRLMRRLQGSGPIKNADAKPLRDALAREGLIDRQEKTALGHRISRVRIPFTTYRAEDLVLKREVFSMVNQVNEMLIGERVFSTGLKAFLDPIYTPKDEKGKKMKDGGGHVIKLNYFQAMEMKGIINAEQSEYFQRHLHSVIENSEKLFSHIDLIQRTDPGAEAGSPASIDAANLRSVLTALAERTTPDSLYELTQSMSKISERLPEFRGMIVALQSDPAKDDLSIQFRKAERRLLPGRNPIGADNLFITPTQRAMRYPMYFGEIEKSAGRLGMGETLAFAQERIECLRKCSAWANYKI